jgi:PAS domain S-box-containing protein
VDQNVENAVQAERGANTRGRNEPQRTSHDRLQSLFPLTFDSIHEGVFTVDESFLITSFNAAAERIIGIPRERAIGRKCHEVFRASICQDGCALRATLAKNEPRRDVRVDVLNADMEQVPIAVSTAVLKDRSGKMIGGVEIFRDISEIEALRTELAGRSQFHDIIGKSTPMQEIFALIPQVARSDAPVLITGPSGTGKEMVAQAIHDLSARNEGPFIRVNCGALPDTLLESELFGHARGAFTGALHSHPGRFRQADGGTLFLDEIGDVSPAFQVKLLRALEAGEIQPLGDTKAIRVDVRLISATNRDIERMVKEDRFREDLYYRIRVFPLELPPLVERRSDIPLLAGDFVRQLAVRSGQDPPELTVSAMEALLDHSYPGNVRELRNILERAFVLSSGRTIDVRHLPNEITGVGVARHGSPADARRRPSDRRIAEASIPSPARQHLPSQARRLLAALDAHGWNRTATAAALGIGRTTLWRRLKEYGLV